MKKLRVRLPSVEGVRYGLFNENSHVTRTSGEERNMWSGVSDQWRKASVSEHCFKRSLLGWSERFSCCWATLLRSISCDFYYFYFFGNYSINDSDKGKNRSALRGTCYHFALYKFHADSSGIECEPSQWEAGDVNDAVSSTGCCGYEPNCQIHDMCVRVCVCVCARARVCVCVCVRMHVYMWCRMSQILSFTLYISNRYHCRYFSQVSH